VKISGKRITVSVDDVYDAGRETSFIDQASKFERRERRNFGRLMNLSNMQICVPSQPHLQDYYVSGR
jgi:hypothetical protein